MITLEQILRTRYAIDGDEVGVALSCLGAVRAVARLRGLPPPDGWLSIRAAWERGEVETASGFPAGWVRQPAGAQLLDGDVLVFQRAGRQGCGIVHEGWVVTADTAPGVYRLPLSRWSIAPAEVWRFVA
ncbi:MAG: hypothetical protein JNK15_03160 [Planctomycetes bacterium]|nr:hypothetical protein [Planctomycetota bacterium]